MYEDNERASILAENSQDSHCSKHIDVRFHFSAGACEIGAGKNSQYRLGGTTCGHPLCFLLTRVTVDLIYGIT